MSTKNMGSLQIKLDLETYKQLKIFCVKQEQKIRDIVEKAIQEYLEKENARERNN